MKLPAARFTEDGHKKEFWLVIHPH